MHRFPLNLILALSAICPWTLSAQDAPQTTPQYDARILECDPLQADEVIAELEKEGVKVLRHRRGLMLCYIPVETSRRTVAKYSGGIKPEFMPRLRNVPTMKNARKFNDAYKIGLGEDLPQAYDGSGVVVGLCDIGFDSRHVNFRSADGKSTRIRRVTQYIEDEGRRIDLTDEQEIYDWHSDSDTDDHATHVAGILTGAYGMDGYQGMAPGADLVVSTSQLTDVGLLAGVEDIIEYAREQKKPAVVNLSMGNYTGPHDGTSLFCRYLDLCAEEAVICLSSGNEGINTNTASFDFTDEHPSCTIQIDSRIDANFTVRGITDLWMADDSPIYVTPKVIDSGAKTVLTLDEIEFKDVPDALMLDLSNAGKDSPLAGMAEYFTGAVYLSAEKDPVNGRYHVMIQYDVKTDIKDGDYNWAKYLLTFDIRGEAGHHINVYADGQYSSLGYLPRALAPACADNSVSDLATGHNTICVGLCYNTDNISTFGGGNWACEAGLVSPYSGFGTLIDGRVMPATCAVGQPVLSSMNSAVLDAHPERISLCGMATDGSYDPKGHKPIVTPESAIDHKYDPSLYYYRPNGGTSMSSPFTAGVIACWLQAAPQLTVDDIRQIISSTNDRSGNAAYSMDPRNGEGWLRPYEGLRQVLSRFPTNVGTISETSLLNVKILDSRIIIANPERETLRLSVYDVCGSLLFQTVTAETESIVDASLLLPGIKILHMESISENGPEKRSETKVIKKFV